MTTSTAPRPRVNAKSRPLNVSLLLTIRETDYAVTVIAHGPDNVKAYRLEKLSGDRETYDLAQTNDGLVVCDCKSYVATHEGTSSTCKHGSALVLMGLLPKPCCVANARAACDDARERAASVAPAPDEPTAPAPYAAHVARLAAIAETEAVVRAGAEAGVEVEPPARVVPAFDADFYRAQNAVAERRALWLSHRHLHTNEPMPAPAKGVATGDTLGEPRLIDDDGTPLETPAEMDARDRAEHAAAAAGLMEGNPFLPACCPDDEPDPCRSCRTSGGPADLGDDAWADDHVWAPSDFPADPDDDEPFASWLDLQAEAFAAIGTPRAKWLAGKIAGLADQARFLDAATPDAFDDRLDAHLDCARAEAEAKASRCC